MWERNRLVSPEFGGASGPGVVVNRVGGGIGGGQRRVGAGPRRLDPARDAAILRAALEGLAELGYDRLSMDDIAARAHVGKAAIYRRWPSKAAVVVGAVAWWREQMGTVAVPDTGSLLGDVEAMIASVPDFDDRDRSMIGVVLGVATASMHDPALADALQEHVLARPRQVLAAVFDRAVARGEIPAGRDLTLVPDILLGMNALRLVTGQSIDRAYVRRVFDDILFPLVTAPVPGGPASGPGRGCPDADVIL
jgi:AcrR family transcriptional regulator